MMNISQNDWQMLSAYVDGELSGEKASRLEKRLEQDQELARSLEQLQKTRQVLRSAPRFSAPRNFSLTREMVEESSSRTGLFNFHFFRLASALATILLAAALVLDFSGLTLWAPVGQVGAPALEEKAAPAESMLNQDATANKAEEPEMEMLAEGEEERLEEDTEALAREEEQTAEVMEEAPAAAPSPSPGVPATRTPTAPESTPLGEEEGIPPIRIIEILLAVGALSFGAGALLTRKNKK